ncbi:hypothetical protein [Flavobacterium restrictum]|uniref:Lipoprotein n=1 Tax=Flavobacterium restrictum TaxID=2594428 RepID=A0A553E941_9FLAO|nr:hypothetical protein [Flavobacterium restrictum]TRX41546.1 hypothetical protein FNW21_05480 [Flavobacterium restrictum]
MKTIVLSIAVALLLTSCNVFSSLNSNTSIKPNEQFLLGNNEHGKFHVTLKNVSNHPIEIHLAPINGGSYSYQTIAIGEVVSTKVANNTVLVIENKSNEYASVDLKVTGDLGLSMGYKNN